MDFNRIEEFLIPTEKHQAIQDLLKRSFADYPQNQSYYKQLPDFRFLVWKKDQLVGHLAVEHRIMNNAEQLITVFGIMDICVHPDFQNKKIATKLIQQLEALAKKNQIDFLVLTTGDYDFYNQFGFKLVQNTCRWLMINQNKTLGISHRRVTDSLMVKSISTKEWKSGLVDFMGTVI